MLSSDASPAAVAHQRLIRERLALEIPREPARSLEGYSVETVARDQALPLIMRYEWLGTLGRTTSLFVGLFSPARELEGVACFGHGPAGGIRNIIGGPALCLERGACVHYAPKNAASFLISHACKLICRLTQTERFFAYADPMAGEYGAVYQAANWAYLGQGLDGGNGRARRYYVLAPGLDRNNHANWKTTRNLRREERMTFKQAREAGWEIGTREAKHVYATHVGRDRRKWLTAIGQKPYPAPRPDLKLVATK
jgi:hypothetical protein